MFPLAGWLFRVRPCAGGRLVIGCNWLPWVRLEGRPLYNPPRIALDAGFVSSGIGLLTPNLIKSQEKSCRGRPLRLPSCLAIELLYETSVSGMAPTRVLGRPVTQTNTARRCSYPPGWFADVSAIEG